METFHENIATPERQHSGVELTAKQKEEGLIFGLTKLDNIKDSLQKYPSALLEEYGLDYIQEKCQDLIALIKKDPALFKNIDLQHQIGNFEPCVAMLDHVMKHPYKENMRESLKKEVFNLSLQLDELLSLEKETIH
ncbi:MAG: hypothetical protein WCV59_01920 [Parcubacteria group bacterium]|jgi:hypothetical protein